MQNKAQIAGILSLVSGGLGLVGFVVVIAMIIFVGYMFSIEPLPNDVDSQSMVDLMGLIYGLCAVVLLIFSAGSIVGGIFALRKKVWGLALMGAICSIFTFWPLGIVATIFISQAQNEFVAVKKNNVATAATPNQS